jgi:Ca-activated chloride channel family protein
VSFEWPLMLLALLLVPLGVAAYLLIEHRRRSRLAAAGGLGLRGREPTGPGRLARRIPAVLFLVAMVLFALALARPQAALSLPRPEGIVMLTFDVSGSMGATDLEPSRLEVAKEVAHAFVDERPTGVVIGLVAFSDAGLSVQAPTTDELELKAAIDRLRPTLGTSLGQGMLAAIDAIERLERGAPPEYYSNRSPEPTLAP